MYSLSAGSLAARKRKAKKDEVKDDSKEGEGGEVAVKTTPALLRIQKDLADLEIPEHCELKKEDEMNFSFILTITSGYWKGKNTYSDLRETLQFIYIHMFVLNAVE